MTVKKVKLTDAETSLRNGAHFLTYAETGFAPLGSETGTSFLEPIEGRINSADLKESIEKFVDEVNNRSELGSLAPYANISAVPRAAIRGPQEDSLIDHLNDFGELYRGYIEQGDVVVEFFIGSHANHVEGALENVFGAGGPYGDINVLWIHTHNW